MKSSWVHFGVLFALLGLGVIAFFQVAGDTQAQFSVGILTAVAYMIWGIIHHSINGDLHAKVVVEYVLVGSIAILLLFLVMRF